MAATTTRLAGLLTIVSALTPGVPWRDDLLLRVEPGSLIPLSHVLAAGAGAALLVLGSGIARGRRRAADAATALLVASAVVHLVKGLDFEEAVVSLCLAGLLRASRGVLVDGAVPRRAVVAGTAAVGAVAAAYTLTTVPLLAGSGEHPVASVLALGAHRLVAGGWWLRSDRPLAVALDALAVGALVGAALALDALGRPHVAREGHLPEEHALAASMVERHGDNSLDPFSLREDKAFHFAHGGFLAYRVLRGTAVVSGDPVGPAGAAPAILGSFLEVAQSLGWRVVVTAASGRYVAAYRRLGLFALHIGEEAVVDPQRFSLEGRAIRKVRQAVRRVERRGWSVTVTEATALGPGTADEVDSLERAWRVAQPRIYGFAMTLGRVCGAPEDDRSVYALGRGPDGRLGAFLRFVPYRRGLSLDTMRRADHGLPNGLNEALVVASLEHARESGLREVSLNFAGFAHVMAADAVLSRRHRLLRFVLRRLHGHFQFERLVLFNERFGPRWRSRYLVYGGRAQLLPSALRVLQAEAYVRPPRTRPLSRRWAPVPRRIGEPLALVQRGAPR